MGRNRSDHDELMSVSRALRETALKGAMSHGTLARLVREGAIPSVAIGRRRYVSRAYVERLARRARGEEQAQAE